MEQLTPLELLAAMALQGFLANSDHTLNYDKNPEQIYTNAVTAAKELRAEIKKQESEKQESEKK